MIFDKITITLTPVDEYSGSVKVVFDPPLPDNEEDIEEDQPILVLLDAILSAISGEGQEQNKEWLQ